MEQKDTAPVVDTNVETSVEEGVATELDTSVAQEGEATGEINTPVESDTLVEGETATTDKVAKLVGLNADHEGEYDSSVLHTPKIVSEIDAASLEQASGDATDGITEGSVATATEETPASTAVGLEDLDPQPKLDEEEQEPGHYYDPVDDYSVFARSLRETLRSYTVTMAPNYPVTPSEMLAQQASLARSLNRVFNHPNVVEFQEAMDVLVRSMKANPETFSVRYINRGMDNVTLSADARKQFETVMFILPISVLSADGRTHYLNYGSKLSSLFPEDKTGAVGNRLQSWIKRYLSIE
jgi:hypothetical protein